MSAPGTILAKVGADDVAFRAARVASSEAQPLRHAPHDSEGRQMAVSVSRIDWRGEPLVVLGVIHGDRQMTVALGPDDMDKLCHLLADGALWQNEQLRTLAGQKVH